MIALNGPYSIYISAADDALRPGPWSKPARRLTWYLLSCSLRGSEQIEVDGSSYVIPEGGSYLIPPGALSSIGSREGSRPAWIHFDVRWESWRGEHLRGHDYTLAWSERERFAQPVPIEVWGVNLPIVIPPTHGQMFAEGIARIVRQRKSHTPPDVMESHHDLAGLLMTWAISVWREKTTVMQTDVNLRIAHAETVARENLGSIFGVSEFASAAGLSRSRFSVVYQRIRGVPPAQFLRDCRMRQAEALLSGTELTVAEIGRTCGYPDPTVFSRVFRRTHGCAPSMWRLR